MFQREEKLVTSAGEEVFFHKGGKVKHSITSGVLPLTACALDVETVLKCSLPFLGMEEPPVDCGVGSTERLQLLWGVGSWVVGFLYLKF